MTDTPTTTPQQTDMQALARLLDRFGVAHTTYGPEDHLAIHGPGTHSVVLQVGTTRVEGYQPLWASWQFHADGRFAEIVIAE